MKTKFTISMMLVFAQISFAQQNQLQFSLSAGMANPAKATKANLIGNGFNLQADAFIPFYRATDRFALGVNIIGNYAGLKNLSPDQADVANQYQVYGGNLTVSTSSAAKRSGNFSGLLGLQGRVTLGKIDLYPALNAGYLHLKQKGFVQNGMATVNGQTQERPLIKADEQSTNGLVFKPQLRIGYHLTDNLSLFVSSAIAMGPQVNYVEQYLVPQGGFNDVHRYEVGQLANGTWSSRTSAVNYHSMEINAGISFALGRSQAKLRTKAVSKGPGAASASYASPGKIQETKNDGDSISIAQRLSMNVTVPKRERSALQNDVQEGKVGSGTSSTSEIKAIEAPAKKNIVEQGLSESSSASEKSISSKGVSASKPAPKAMALPGTPIGGIVVKGGKNPGGDAITVVTNNKGEFEFAIREAGEYRFALHFGEKVAQGLQHGSAKISNKMVHEETVPNSSITARPGQPIKGVIVKGGKNPGGNLMVITPNDNGEFGTSLEAGNYKFTISEPQTAQGKSISSKGVKRQAAAREVRTYTGGRKNEPQGKSIDQKGVSPAKPKTSQKVKEKATSGLKDVVKTQV